MDKLDSRRNVQVLLWAGIMFGLTLGIYELALPLYMASRGFTPLQGSLVFAVSAGVSIVFRLWVGRISDRLGRKAFYSLSLLGAGVASLLTPLFPFVTAQIVLKSLREACVRTRDALHSVFLYETAKEKFIAVLGRTEGAKVFFWAVGMVLTGYGLQWALGGGGYLPVLVVGGVVCLAAAALSAMGLRETYRPGRPAGSSFFRELVSLRLDPRLYVLMAFMLVFSMSIGASHTYVMFKFWKDKFGLGAIGVGWIMAGHRLTFALPMYFVGAVVRGRMHRHRRLAMILMVCFEGVVLAASGMISVFSVALVVWLLHDLLGAGLWVPIRDSLLQRYCRGEVRATDTSKALALGEVGFVLGALLGGWCYGPQAAQWLRLVLPLPAGDGALYGLPFVVGGAFMLLSALPLLALLVIDPEERGEAAYPAG